MKSDTVLLIDVDSTIPNLALMKLSRYYKDLGYKVELLQLNISFYPHKNKNRKAFMVLDNYYKVYVSAIFNDNWKFVYGEGIEYGGSSYSLLKTLPDYIDCLDPDHTIYNVNYSVDFITRGCIRNCYFCIVPKKEGCLHLYKDVDTIIKEVKARGHNKIMFLDNNILAYNNHIEVLEKLVQSGLKIDLNQGLDFRLLTKENQKLLNELKYESEYIFAFDDIKYKNLLERKKKLLKAFGKWKVKLYLFVDTSMSFSSIVNRINYCKDNNYLPYIMRHIDCYIDKNKDFYTDISAYCNQPSMFKKLDFSAFLYKRHSNNTRIINSLNLWRELT